VLETPASGVTPRPPDPIDVSGGGTNFHNPGDAPASTTTSNNGGPTNPYADVTYLFWGSAWNSSSLNPGIGAIYRALSKLDDRFNNPTTNYFSKLRQYGVGGPGGSAPFSGGFSSSIGPLVIPANPPNVSDSEITVNAPSNAAEAVDVTLYTDVGTTVTSAADVYTYI